MSTSPRGADSKFYDLLGVDRTADMNKIKSAFKKLAVLYHPDKNPATADKFDAIHKAYLVLSDSSLRDIYDKIGEKGLEKYTAAAAANNPTATTAAFMQKIASTLSPPPATSVKPSLHMPQRVMDLALKGNGVLAPGAKVPALMVKIPVSLEEMYIGVVKVVRVASDVICPSCQGRGGNTTVRCPACSSLGLSAPLPSCRLCFGLGDVALPNDTCPTCEGRKVMKSEHDVVLRIDRGTSNDQKFTFSDQGDQKPGNDTGDLILVVEQTKHSRFKRSGFDLLTEVQLSLREALCGYQVAVEQLDGRSVALKSPTGKVTRPDDILVIRGEGMPVPRHQGPMSFGQMIIKVKVLFPEDGSLNSAMIGLLQQLLPTIPKYSAGNTQQQESQTGQSSQAGNRQNTETYFRESQIVITPVPEDDSSPERPAKRPRPE